MKRTLARIIKMLMNMPSINGVLQNQTTIIFKSTENTDHIALVYNTLKLTVGR